MPYFRSSFLNGLRDELWLTMTFQKMTLFHLLSLGLPVAGLGAGIVSGMRIHAVWAAIVRGGIGLAAGIVIAWLLPRVLWKMLWLLADRRWFLQPEPPAAVPVISRNELLGRLEAANRDLTWYAVKSIAIFMVGVLCFTLILKFVERVRAPDWVSLVVLLAMIAFIIAFLVSRHIVYTRLLAKHGLACPNCRAEIARIGPCWHCGAAVVQEKPQ